MVSIKGGVDVYIHREECHLSYFYEWQWKHQQQSGQCRWFENLSYAFGGLAVSSSDGRDAALGLL